MSIGLMDADMACYTLVPFNLEIMKLSAYYKKKGEIVVLSPSFLPERHEKFFFRKDWNDGFYPSNLTTAGNVEYGGLAFSNNKYQPLPIEIEKMHPDSSIYSKMEDIILRTTVANRKKIFQNMMEAEHCRLSLDGKTIWPDYPYQFRFLRQARNLMIHDYNLAAIDNSFETVQEILSKARTDGWATRVGMKFPVQANDGETLLKWSSIRSNSTFFSLRYNGVMENEVCYEWIRKCHERAVYTQMEYHVTVPWCSENHFLEVLLPKILRQIIISRSYRVFFSLTYDEGYFSDPQWEQVLRFFNYYHNSMSGIPTSGYYQKIDDDTMFDFAKKIQKVPQGYYGEVMNVQDVRKVFAFVRQKNYNLFKDFYECNVRSLGGKL